MINFERAWDLAISMRFRVNDLANACSQLQAHAHSKSGYVKYSLIDIREAMAKLNGILADYDRHAGSKPGDDAPAEPAAEQIPPTPSPVSPYIREVTE